MKISIIYNSYSGNTRNVAESVHAACGGKLVEVQSKEYQFRLAAYIIGCYRAMKEKCDRIKPETIDVSSDDLIIIGTPVWAGKPTPAINGAVTALVGCNGKPAVIYATCGGNEGETLPMLKKALEARGMTVVREFVFNKEGIKDQDQINVMISAVRTTAERT